MVISTRLFSYLPANAPIQMFGAESYVWSGCGLGLSREGHGLVSGAVDQR